MNPTGNKRNGVTMERIVFIGAFLAILFAFTKTDVTACLSWQQCLTISECRKLQKQTRLSPNAKMDFSTALLYPCNEPLKGMICCNVKAPEEPEDEDPGYTITYGDSPQASEPLPVPLPLELSKSQKDVEVCGVFQKGSTKEDASLWQFPWLALIGNYDFNSGTPQFHCGGTLINRHYVLTSASCIKNMKSSPDRVRLGEFDLSTENDSGLRLEDTGLSQDYEVEIIKTHELHDNPFMKNDIALLRLKGSVPKLQENVMPICLPTETVVSEVYTVAGWGINDKRNFTVTPKYGTITLDPPKTCEANLAIPLQPVGDKQLCSSKVVGSCFGDGGGPLMSYMKKDNEERAVLVGIISYRDSKCNSPFAVDLYTNVASYMDWITKNTIEPQLL